MIKKKSAKRILKEEQTILLSSHKSDVWISIYSYERYDINDYFRIGYVIVDI